LTECKPDLLLLDVSMPVMEGYGQRTAMVAALLKS